MGSTREEQERVRSLLLDTVTLLCKNGLNFKKQLKVQGLLGITLDEDDVFIVHINEKVGELVVEHQKKDKHYEDSDESSIDSPPAKVNRKRRSDSSPMFRGPPDKMRIKTEKEEPDADADLILVEDHDDDKKKIQSTLLQQQPGLHSVTNFQTGYQPYGHPNNVQGGPGYMTSPGVVNNTQQHTLPHQNMPQTGQPTPEKHTGQNLQEQYHNMDFWVPRSRRKIPYQEKAFVCDFPGCGLAYNIRSNLLRHQNLKHGRQNFRRTGKQTYSIVGDKLVEANLSYSMNNQLEQSDQQDDSHSVDSGKEISQYSNVENRSESFVTDIKSEIESENDKDTDDGIEHGNDKERQSELAVHEQFDDDEELGNHGSNKQNEQDQNSQNVPYGNQKKENNNDDGSQANSICSESVEHESPPLESKVLCFDDMLKSYNETDELVHNEERHTLRNKDDEIDCSGEEKGFQETDE